MFDEEYINEDEQELIRKALITETYDINRDSLDTCEGARWSAYISSDMKMMPCSFDNQDLRWAVDIRKHTIEEAWKSEVFDSFR